jgi:hypothetical protein
VTLAAVVCFVAVLSNAQIMPMGGITGSSPGTPTLDKKGANTTCASQCPGTPPATSATLNATAGTVVAVQVFAAADAALSLATAQTDLTTLSDGTDTYTFDQFCGGTAPNSGWWLYHVQSAAGGTLTLTATFALTRGYYGSIMWSSWTGMAGSAVFDQGGCAFLPGQHTPATVTTSGNLAQSNELVYAGFFSPGPQAAGTGFTILNNPNSPADNVNDEYAVQGSSGSTTSATMNYTGTGDTTAIIGTFKHQ